jgi:ATP-dependent exoDNAse (exonuclease V) beta subunit
LAVEAEVVTAEQGSDLVSPVSIQQIVGDSSRPHGKRFGSLVHAVVSVVALDADRDGVEKVAELQGRILGASREEVDAAIETVVAVIRHPTILQGVGSNNYRREVPVTLKLQDNLMIEGVVDLAYRVDSANGAWTVVDYKTDFEIQGRVEEYSRQVWLYALAISRATGMKSRPVLLRV